MRQLLLAFLLVTVPEILGAQQNDSRQVKFRVLCFEHVQGILKAFVPGPGDQRLEVDFYTGGFGPQTTAGFPEGKVRFYQEKTDPAGKVTLSPVAEGTLHPSPVQVFLLLPETKPGHPPYRVLAFDDREESFSMGSTRVINLAPAEIRLNLAGAVLAPVKSGGMAVYPQVKRVDEWNMYSAQVEFLAGDQWIPVANQSWKASNRKRDWVIAQLDVQSNNPVIRLYQDVPPWREPRLVPAGQGK